MGEHGVCGNPRASVAGYVLPQTLGGAICIDFDVKHVALVKKTKQKGMLTLTNRLRNEFIFNLI